MFIFIASVPTKASRFFSSVLNLFKAYVFELNKMWQRTFVDSSYHVNLNKQNTFLDHALECDCILLLNTLQDISH